MIQINKFKTEPFITALKDFFKELNIPVNYLADEPANAAAILDDKYKPDNEAHKLIDEVYALGIVNNDAFKEKGLFEDEDTLKDIKSVKNNIKKDYDGLLLFGVTLNSRPGDLLPTRGQLAEITRSFNRAFPYTPVTIIFKYNAYITFANSERIPYKVNKEGEKAGKVTMLKDIFVEKPHAAHERILLELKINYEINTFDALYKHWQKVLDTKELNKQFFQELANWYFWATQKVTFPNDEETNKDILNATNVIRLITRIMFVWFVKEKNLVSDDLFDKKKLEKILKFTDKNGSTYYKAILQNLFFATLNTEMGKRKFRSTTDNGRDAHFFIHNLFRYQNEFIKPDETLETYFSNVPFLNGGLFECLDKEVEVDGKLKRVRIDGFSDRTDNVLTVPDELFFSDKEQIIDLSTVYGTPKKSKEKVRGLIDLLNNYKFTITENTPIEEEVALDPELLGKVFENLLANYNPETQTTARKQTGSFYTPREIVNYMVDESLIAYLIPVIAREELPKQSEQSSLRGGTTKQSLNGDEIASPTARNDEELQLRNLLSYSEKEITFTAAEKEKLINAIDTIKILDPACGSGAFPMGILHKLVHVLHKLDPKNQLWKQRQIEKAEAIDDAPSREAAIEAIEEAFENNELDYGRKLYLIENCIFGVDIQPVAVQISKLRFFISLIVEQRTNANKENLGVRPLPNLETKFVAANTLIALEKENANLFTNPEIDKAKEQLKKIRHDYFEARTPKRKENCRAKDKELRNHLAELLVTNHDLQPATAKKVATWNPYDQNATAPFFDMEWMFGFNEGFDVVIGNPPFIFTRDADFSVDFKNHIDTNYFSLLTTKDIKSKANQSGKINLFALFIMKGLFDTKKKGVLSLIVPNNLLRTTTYDLIRKYILDNAKIEELVDLGSGIFDNVTASTIVFRLKNEKNTSNHKTKIITDIKNIEQQDFLRTVIEQNQFKINVSYTFNIFADNLTNILLTKISSGKEYLGKLCIDIIEGIVAHKHLISELESKNSQPLLEGKTIKRFGLNIVNKFIIWDVKEIHRTRPEYLWNAPKKIIIQRISGGSFPLKATIDIKKYKTFASINNLLLKPEYDTYYEFILALINSHVLNWYYANSFSNNSDLTVNISKTFLEKLPIPKVSTNTIKLFTIIVDKIISTKEENPKADTSALEKQIDIMVYKLYQLTYEEVLVIDKDFSTQLSKEEYDALDFAFEYTETQEKITNLKNLISNYKP